MPTLLQINRALLVSARQAEEKAFRRWLANGLMVQVEQLKSGDVVLTLERKDVDPGLNEWKTVLSKWPEPVPPDIVPTQRTEGRAHRLIGRWPRPATLFEPA